MLASDSRTLAASRGRRVRRSAHHLFARLSGIRLLRTIFVDRFLATGDDIVESELGLGVYLREASRGGRFGGAIKFAAISQAKAASMRRCEGRSIAC